MGDLQAWIPQPNFAPGLPSPASNPHPTEVADSSWRRAEEATADVIESIQPTMVSERRRKEVVEYVQRLIGGFLGCEVFPFGSVPLRTYLPDGDIDLTALAMPNSEDNLANDVRSVLEMEEQNEHAEFEVKDVQYIHAEVKLVKCLVQNIVVDISFNQIGGLCTLCFLEKVDQLIAKDHLFKRSIILIKAWCYYESRILGAHHGLISTYALETLVLYIFHLFHSSLDGPLAVLYRFLEYYSKFDWDNYCISLYGPVSVSSLPELVADTPENEGGELLLPKEFLKKCSEMFSVPPRGFESNSRIFPQKHLNIIDPLKENNNLGRSVSRANFYRIRSAFTYGARKLGKILLLPSNRMEYEVKMFFTNTLDRHGSGERPDVRDALPNCLRSTSNNHKGVASAQLELKATDPDGQLCEEINAIKLEINTTKFSGPEENGTTAESNGLLDDRCLVGDGRDHAAGRSSVPSHSRGKNKTSLSANEKSKPQSGKYFYASYLPYHPENVRQNGGPGVAVAAKLAIGDRVSSTRPLPSHEEVRLVQLDSSESESSTSSSTSWLSNHGSLASSWNTLLPNSHPSDCSFAGTTGNGCSESPEPNKLSDLSGDVELHFRSLQYAQLWQESILGTIFPPGGHLSSSFQFQNKHSWDPTWRRGVYTNFNTNGMPPGPPFPHPGSYPIAQSFISGAYGIEDLPKPRGTGTYFPNTNYHTYNKERQSSGRGKNPGLVNNLSRHRNNGRAETPQDTNFQEKSNLERPEQLQLPVINGTYHGKMAVLDVAHTARSALKENNTNGFVFPREGRLEFGSFGSVPLGASSTEPGKRPDSVSPRTPGPGQAIPASNVLRPSMGSNHERSTQAYQLKDEGDFPPLSG
ncbi:uncharacterized protein M6B38_174290 [Iris pallida]|uniref:PAP/OAS1 substrate-binding domain superfamily n=1 Tax=Iris pallida TaxID=29817 RepID=A0AAX6ERI7_IRIPA|nr:uncharacterized protein M6B38_174290 [Iris pallida]